MVIYLVLDATNEPIEAFYGKERAIAYATARPGCRVMMISVNK